jgi:chromosome segregation ATPase
MSENRSAPSGHKFARDAATPADPTFVAKLQQVVNRANENCDRASALAHKLSAQLREAQSRINQLELEADGLADRLRSEADSAIAKLQSEANTRVDETKREADAELAQAKQRAEQAEAGALIAHDRLARAEADLSRVWAEVEDRFIHLSSELAQAEHRADRAEKWLVLIRREIEEHLMPAFAAMHDRLKAAPVAD